MPRARAEDLRAAAIVGWRALTLVAAFATAAACASPVRHVRERMGAPPSPEEMAQLWVHPAGRDDLLHGPDAPGRTPADGDRFSFVRADTTGASRGYDVKDAAGLVWSVKLGEEARPEIVASRLLWAAGFHQEPMCYVSRWTLVDGPRRGEQPPGRFMLRPQGHHRAGHWSFFDNPFVGTRPYKGLLLILLLVNDWDLLDSNNTVFELDRPAEGASRWYVVKDLGASLGGSHFFPQGTKDDPDGFARTTFVKRYDGTKAVLGYAGRRYRALYAQEDIDDVRWVCERLGRLQENQWRDGFRAGGYTEEEASRYIARIREKLATALPSGR